VEGNMVAGLVLAAGRGTRFSSETGPPMPKVLRPILGRPIVAYVLQAMRDAGVGQVTIIIGFEGDKVRQAVGPGYGYVVQPEQKGSGHAVACAREAFDGFDGDIVIMCGDSPLFRADTLREMIDRHRETGAVITLASAVLDDPTGYGRIVRSRRSDKGHPGLVEGAPITGIVEEKCASDAERAVKEVNGGAYVFDCRWLFGNIHQMAVNETGEQNLTDMVRVAVEQNRTIASVPCEADDIAGVNTPEELRAVEAILRSRGINLRTSC
jgi:bifunctional UDP-N-acetylglucosamine pyrophosphorylase/glucosamine-1-phosphate N-acetyltransferase